MPNRWPITSPHKWKEQIHFKHNLIFVLIVVFIRFVCVFSFHVIHKRVDHQQSIHIIDQRQIMAHQSVWALSDVEKYQQIRICWFRSFLFFSVFTSVVSPLWNVNDFYSLRHTQFIRLWVINLPTTHRLFASFFLRFHTVFNPMYGPICWALLWNHWDFKFLELTSYKPK